MVIVNKIDDGMTSGSRSNSQKSKTRTSKGRQKIAIKKVEKKSNLQVTFSKRRQGLFMKASELCVLTGSQVGIIAFSPKDKPFCFAHPNIDDVLANYLKGNSTLDEEEHAKAGPQSDICRALSKQYEDALRELEEEKKRAEIAKTVRNNEGGGFWWDEPIEGMGLKELEECVTAMQELKRNLIMRASSKMEEAAVAAPAAGGHAGLAMGIDGAIAAAAAAGYHYYGLGSGSITGAQYGQGFGGEQS